MTETPTDPFYYRVTYSGRVRDELKKLVLRAQGRSLGRLLLDSLKELDKRLRIYPQFGEPLRDWRLQPLRLWVGVVPPLVVQYLVDEDKRLVFVAVPIMALPRSGLDP